MPPPASKARLAITALFVDHQTPSEVAARYGVHRGWVYKLKARYEIEGETALEPHSRPPKTSPAALAPEVVDLIVRVRKELSDAGLDAGPDTIAWHLEHHHRHQVSRSTISRHLTRSGLVTPEPKKRPKSSYIRFQASMPNRDLAIGLHPLPAHPPRHPTRHRCRDHQLARRLHPLRPPRFRTPGDHHRDREGHLPRNRRPARHPGLHPHRQRHGLHRPTDRHRTPRRPQRIRAATADLERGPEELTPRTPHHLRQGREVPADPEEVAARPTPAPSTIAELQTLIDAFVDEYNQRRPHRSLPHRATPATLYDSMPKAMPGPTKDPETHERVRHDRVDKAGSVTLRHNSRLHHIGIGRTHAGTCVILLIQDLQIRIANAATGELLRELILDPTRDCQPTGTPKGPTRRPPK
jgi:transposase